MRTYLVKLREQRNESQQDVADALNISRQYYSMIEKGERQRKMDTTLMTAIAAHFGISAVDVLEYENELRNGGLAVG